MLCRQFERDALMMGRALVDAFVKNDDSGIVFLMGDLNYRITMDPETVRFLVMNHNNLVHTAHPQFCGIAQQRIASRSSRQ